MYLLIEFSACNDLGAAEQNGWFFCVADGCQSGFRIVGLWFGFVDRLL